jgi:DNA primase large subunit
MDLHSEGSNKFNGEQITDSELYEERRQDHISHFILRLAYCQSEDLKRWFIAQELDLFRYRLESNPDDLSSFLHHADLQYTPISEEEKRDKMPFLVASSIKLTEGIIRSEDYFKVHFTEALDLVRGRKVYLEKGYAYIPKQDLVSIIQGTFRSMLSRDLAITARSLPSLEEEDRLMPMLKNFSHHYVGENYANKQAGRVTPEDIDTLSRKSFPLCMRQLHQALRDNHHLKHFGRLQYGLFLKGIGLTLEDALRFWRTEFVKIMDGEKFEKSYSYNVRHSYGKEGKRANYTPYSCLKIIISNSPGPGDHHGCPFKHSDPDLLKQRLHAYKQQYPKLKVDEVMELVEGQHYQLACIKYFELTHEIADAGFSLNHPNQYFDESRRLLSGDHPVKSEKMDYMPTPTPTHAQLDDTDFLSDLPDESFIGMDESCATNETQS